MTYKSGQVFESNHWGAVVIVSLSPGKAVVRFINTDNEQEFRRSTLSKGSFTDSKEYERIHGRSRRAKGEWSVGEVLASKHWGDFEVVAVHPKRLDIKFINTGNSKNVAKNMVVIGQVEDSEAAKAGVARLNYESPQRTAAKISSGTLYKSNYWGDVEVLEYNSSTDVKVRFIESGNVSTVQKDALEKGLIKDLDRQMRETSDRYAEEKAEADLGSRLQEHHRHIENINNKINQTHSRMAKILLRHSIKSAKQAEMFSVRNHERYGDYQIVDYAEGRCTVRFLSTGGEFKTTAAGAKGGRVRDFSQFSKEDEKEFYRQRNADNYLANREVRLQQAKDWQKANPEKSRVRNRNRRAKRINAEGTHTESQTTALLELQDHKCNSCGICLHTTEKHLDHIMPLDLGGSNWIENLQWLCQFCNNSKSNKHPDDWAEEILTEHWQARRKQRLETVL